MISPEDLASFRNRFAEEPHRTRHVVVANSIHILVPQVNACSHVSLKGSRYGVAFGGRDAISNVVGVRFHYIPLTCILPSGGLRPLQSSIRVKRAARSLIPQPESHRGASTGLPRSSVISRVMPRAARAQGILLAFALDDADI
jgi:hypothetical protein